jgi:hypothetical protein
MRTLSTPELATLAYERGEEFDPAASPTPALVQDLPLAAPGGELVATPSRREIGGETVGDLIGG